MRHTTLVRGAVAYGLRLAGWVVTASMLAAVLGLAALFLGPRAFDVQPLIVLTGSMEPTLPTGGIAYMRPLARPSSAAPPEVDRDWTPTSAIRAGDIITFRVPRDPRMTVSHRVIAVIEDEDGRRFQTQGDHSDHPDVQPVLASNVVGTVVFAVPRLGYVADWLRHGTSFLMLLGTPTAIVVLVESAKIARDARRGRTTQDAQPNPIHGRASRLART
ncbi:MAG: signal peptidase I [Dehalococcoidia bacterium]